MDRVLNWVVDGDGEAVLRLRCTQVLHGRLNSGQGKTMAPMTVWLLVG